MKCDFCGRDLPVVAASNDTDVLVDTIYRIEPEDRSHAVLDLNERYIYRYWSTHLVQPVEGFTHLCKTCAHDLDVFGAKLLETDCQRRVRCARSIATNAINKRAGLEIPPYMVAFDISLKDHPVAQVCRKDGDRWVLTNTIMGDAVGHIMTYMEDSTYVK